ncbi:MAG: ribosome-associated translation inhibitor RaiA [Propionibacteriaceae bacterium]|jgi:ribosomal subunit interface protein|nr:ribosome-associated translation inhibitor RaiA [Propionibacteriaceae bacterium]
MDIKVSGRKIQLPEAYIDRVTDKLASISRLKNRIDRIEVQVTANDHVRARDDAVLVEITLRSKGPVIRAEAYAEDKETAFDAAFDKLKAILRRAADRRKSRRGLRDHGIYPEDLTPVETTLNKEAAEVNDQPPVRKVAGLEVQGDGPLVVREKTFYSEPLTLAQALDEMELVGHDFFLYLDAETATPSVVYRRRGYNYGVIHLNAVK